MLKPTKSKAITCLLLSSLALTVYVTLPQAFQTSGAEVLFPQAIGMWFLSIVLSFGKRDEISWRQVRKNFGTGIAWSIANISLFLAIPIIGVAKSFTFSQLAVLISIYAGLVLLKVKNKNRIANDQFRRGAYYNRDIVDWFNQIKKSLVIIR